MKKKAYLNLFQDPLSGKRIKGWIISPDNFIEHPQYGTVYFLDWQKKKSEFPLVGDKTWRNYRVELEVFPVSRNGYLGVNFHVQPDSSACNFHFPIQESGRNEAFQSMCIWGKSCAWKLYPESQGYALLPSGEWLSLCIDVTETFSNLYVQNSSKPILTLFDLPFNCGGIQFWSFLGSSYFRNLRVTELLPATARLAFDNPWKIYNKLGVIRKWRVTMPQKSDFGLTGIPEILFSTEMKWLDVEGDRRGVINLSSLFPGNNTKASVFAKTIIMSDKKEKRTCRLTYTDRFTIWCNDKLIFEGPPRGWDDPGRETHFGGRLIPDEFEVKIALNSGENIILIRSEVTEPWGWGFWMRVD